MLLVKENLDYFYILVCILLRCYLKKLMSSMIIKIFEAHYKRAMQRIFFLNILAN